MVAKMVRSALAWILFCFSYLGAEGFVAGTLVKVPRGYKLIEEIKRGDLVCSINKNGFEVLSIVEGTNKSTTSHRAVITTEQGEILELSAEQCFLVHDVSTENQTDWIAGKNLSIEHRLCSTTGPIVQTAVIVRGDNKDDAEPRCFYNLSVAGTHAYYVTKSNIVAHNGACASLSILKYSWGGGGTPELSTPSPVLIIGFLLFC